MRHQAIRNLYPQVAVIQDGIGCFDSAGLTVEVDEESVKTETDRLLTDYMSLEYRRQRAFAYPSLTELADALYWQSQGNAQPMTDYLAACAEVKARYPKGDTNA